MTALRPRLAALGVGLAGLGLAFVAVPDLARVVGLPRLAVALLGALALVEGARSLQSRRRTEIEGAEPPDPEARHDPPRPGDDFDERVASLGRRRGRSWDAREHDQLRDRLRAAAVEAVAHHHRLAMGAARDRVEAGDWTDDPAAAWYLGGPAVPGPPWSVRLRGFLGGGSPVEFYARRTVDAIVELRGAS